MNRCRQVGPICRPSDSDSGSTKGTEIIQCVDGRYLQMHEIWCLSSDRITREVHPTAQLDVSAVVIGQFLSNYLAKNGRRIPILGQICINGSVKCLGIPKFHRTSGPMYTENILAPHDTTGWGARRFSVYMGSLVLWKFGIPKSSTLPLMQIWPRMGILRPFSAR